MRCILILGLLAPVLGGAQPVYEWTDENGVRHFASEPPSSVQALEVEIRPDPPPRLAEPGEEEDPLPVNEIVVSEPSAEEVAARARLNARRRVENCEWAREAIPAIESRPRIAVESPDGSTRYLTHAERTAKLAEARRIARENCD